jgi:hypothetical protein
MDEKTLESLNLHAEAVAERLGVHAAVNLSEVEESDFNPGARAVLTVFRDPSGPSLHINFPAEARDLQARIEQEIPVLAQQL